MKELEEKVKKQLTFHYMYNKGYRAALKDFKEGVDKEYEAVSERLKK